MVDRRLTFIDRRGSAAIEAMRPEAASGEPLPQDVEKGGTGFRRSDDGTI